MRKRRAAAEQRVLAVIASVPDARHYGWPTARAARTGAGTLYPALARFCMNGWVTRHREEVPSAGKHPRIWYRITPLGQAEAVRVVGTDRQPREDENEANK